MVASSGTPMSCNSMKTNVEVMTTCSDRLQTDETTAGTVVGTCNVEPHLISPEWTNLVTSINLRPLIAHKETPSTTRFARNNFDIFDLKLLQAVSENI